VGLACHDVANFDLIVNLFYCFLANRKVEVPSPSYRKGELLSIKIGRNERKETKKDDMD
jgi:hypothetical protein